MGFGNGNNNVTPPPTAGPGFGSNPGRPDVPLIYGDNVGYGEHVDSNGNLDLSSIGSPFFKQDRNNITDLLAGRSPFAGAQDWGSLISQLQARASGDPSQSLAVQNYNIANQNAINNIGSLARGSGTAGAAQTAIQQAGRLGQGQASGLALAQTQEQQANQQLLSQALTSRDTLNNNAFNSLMQQKLQLSDEQLQALKADQAYHLGKVGNDNQSSANTLGALATVATVIAAAADGGPSKKATGINNGINTLTP